MYVYKEVLSVSTRKGTNICEFAWHRLIYKSICDRTYVCLWVDACIQRESASTRRGTNICEFAQHGFIYKPNYPWYDMYTNTCQYTYTKRFKLWALAMARTSVRLHRTGWCTKVSVMEYIYLWAHVCMQRGSECQHSQGHRHMWVRTTWVHI